jgi:hypothetical protein
MDVFIPYGGVQNNNGDELRFTLRSIEKYVSGVRDIYITTEAPAWVRNTKEVNTTDSTNSPHENVQKKLLAFCNKEMASEEFIFWHDDTVALAPFVASELLFYATASGDSSFMSPKNFEVHTPVRYHKASYKELFTSNPLPKSVNARSLYLNFMRAPATEYDDWNPKIGDGFPSLEDQAKNRKFVAFNDRTIAHPEIKNWLRAFLPDRSKYESE